MDKDSSDLVSPRAILSKAASHFRRNVLDDMKAATVIMFPTDVLLLTKVPPHLRVPFASVTGVGWVLFLSWTRGDVKVETEAPSPAKVYGRP